MKFRLIGKLKQYQFESERRVILDFQKALKKTLIVTVGLAGRGVVPLQYKKTDILSAKGNLTTCY